MSKKIISLVLAVLMIVSVFAVSASAYGPVSTLGIKLVTDAKIGDTVGTEVTVSCYLTLPEGTDLANYRQSLTNVGFLYNSQYYTYKSRTIGASYAKYFNEVTCQVNTNFFATVQSVLPAEDKSIYNAGIINTQNWEPGGTYSGTKTGYEIDPNCPIWTITFTVAKTLDSSDAATFSVPEEALGRQVRVTYFEGTKSIAYTASSLSVAEATKVAPAAAQTYKVSDDNVQIRRNLNDASKYDLRFVGSFKTADIEAKFAENSNTSTNITSVGCEVTFNGVTNTYTDGYIYPTTDGYKFAAIMPGLDDSMADMDITVKMFVVVDGKTEYSKGVTTKLSGHTNRLPA